MRRIFAAAAAAATVIVTVVAEASSAGIAPAVADVPPVGDAARAAGFVDVRTVVPDAVIDLRYATTNNFTHTQLYPSDARCLVHQSMAPGLAAAATVLRSQGQQMVFVHHQFARQAGPTRLFLEGEGRQTSAEGTVELTLVDIPALPRCKGVFIM